MYRFEPTPALHASAHHGALPPPQVYRFEAISRALAAAPEFAMALTRPGDEAIAAEAAAEAEAAQMAAEVVAEAAALERRHVPYKRRNGRTGMVAVAAAAAEQQQTTTTTRVEGDAVEAAEAPTAAMAAAAATAAMTAAAAAITAAEATMALKEGSEVAADEAAEGVASGAAASSGASACIRLDQCMHASSVASSPMDVAVHAFDRRFERLERARHGAGLCEHAGTLTLTLPLTTYTGRVNEETFAKEAVWLANDRLVATGGDCGRLYLWSAVSGRLVYRAQADGSMQDAESAVALAGLTPRCWDALANAAAAAGLEERRSEAEVEARWLRAEDPDDVR